MSQQLQLDELKRGWIDESIPKAVAVIYRLGEFEAFDLRRYLTEPPSVNYFGILTSQLKRQGYIKEAGFKPSRNPGRNGARCLFWHSV